MRDGLHQVTRGPICAGFTIEDGRVAMCAPILRKQLAYWQTLATRVDATRYLILATGSREFTDRDLVCRDLLAVQAKWGCRPDQIVVVEGEAPGLDSIARDIATELGMRVEPHPADWDNCVPECKPGHRKRRRDGSEYCPSAGHRRNAVMVELVAHGEAAGRGVIAYPVGASPGTRGCMAAAEAAGLTVWNRTDH